MTHKMNILLSTKLAALGRMPLVLVLALACTPISATLQAAEEPPEVTYDGLHRLHETEAALAYAKPDVDLSVYDRLLILDCPVAFRKNWQRDKNRDALGLSGRVSDADMERIKNDMAELFREVFIEELDEEGGYEVVDKPAEDVLLIRPAIIDLDVEAPDLRTAGRTRTFTSSAGAATLYIELYDSVSGEILARAIDRKADRDYGTMQWTSRVTNAAAAKRIVRVWAGLLRQRLDEMHGKGQ